MPTATSPIWRRTSGTSRRSKSASPRFASPRRASTPSSAGDPPRSVQPAAARSVHGGQMGCAIDPSVGAASSSEVPNVDVLPMELRHRIGRAWRDAALAEHASSVALARFVMELLAIGAPLELVGAAQHAIADETMHAQLAFGLARAYL